MQRAVEALTTAGKKVAQLVLVTPVGGPTGTGIFGFGAGKSRPNVLSKLEQQVCRSRALPCGNIKLTAQLLSGAGGSDGWCQKRLHAVQVVDSGLPYLIVRTAVSDKVPDRYAEQANVVVASFGSLPQGLSVARSQVRSCACLSPCAVYQVVMHSWGLLRT